MVVAVCGEQAEQDLAQADAEHARCVAQLQQQDQTFKQRLGQVRLPSGLRT